MFGNILKNNSQKQLFITILKKYAYTFLKIKFYLKTFFL